MSIVACRLTAQSRRPTGLSISRASSLTGLRSMGEMRAGVIAMASVVVAAGAAAAFGYLTSGKSKTEAQPDELIFLGTGSSTGVPTPRCVLDDPVTCKVCASALAGPPEACANYRNNPSALIRFKHSDGRRRCVQFDACKTFRDAVLRWYPRHGITRLDALILSHEHADAVLGLDDIRGVQREKDPPLPVYLASRDLESLKIKFPYLMPNFQSVIARSVSSLDWRVITALTPFDVEGLEVLPLPVVHGSDYIAFGYMFGEVDRVAYISDASAIPDDVYGRLAERPLELLIIDALLIAKSHTTHFSMPEAIAVARRLKPRRTLLTGLSHQFDHETVNAELSRLRDSEGLDVQLARDGLSVPLRLKR